MQLKPKALTTLPHLFGKAYLPICPKPVTGVTLYSRKDIWRQTLILDSHNKGYIFYFFIVKKLQIVFNFKRLIATIKRSPVAMDGLTMNFVIDTLGHFYNLNVKCQVRTLSSNFQNTTPFYLILRLHLKFTFHIGLLLFML